MKSSDTQMELVRRYLGGEATLEEARRLESMLAVDAQLRRDYLAYARVEAGLSSKVRPKLVKTAPPNRWLFWCPLTAAAALAVMLALGGIFLRSDADTGLIVASADMAVEVRRGGMTLRLPVGATVLVKDVIESGGATVVLSYPAEATRLELAAGTCLEVLPHHDGKKLRLLAGVLTAEVAPQPEAAPMRLFSENAEAVVLGTRFTMRSDSASSELSVQKGAVRVKREVPEDSVLVGTSERVDLTAETLSVAKVSVMESTPWRDNATLHFDFEQAGVWPHLRAGRLTSGPEEPQEKAGRCLAAELYQGENPLLKFGVSLRTPCKLQEDTVLKVRYWAGAEVKAIHLSVYAEKGRAHVARLDEPVHGRWAEWSVPLAGLLLAEGPERQHPLPAGSSVRVVSLTGSRAGSAPHLYFDDLTISPTSYP